MNSRHLLLPLAGLLTLAFTGCMSLHNRRHHEASSVVQFLYPDKNQPFIQPQIPTLRLPLRVGVAFIPAGFGDGRGGFRQIQANFTEQQKTELMRKVAAQFKALPFVQSIEIIPTTYLRPGGGFENLDQLRAMMGIDVITLIAYDQTQNSSETEASIAYWTIVGAYIVEGQRNSTHTLMEAVVYDIRSRSLLFRAPGTSTIKNHATLFRNDYELKKSSAASIEEASAQMTANLAQELELFKVRAKEEPDAIKIEHKPGYTGAGSLDGWFAALLLLLLGAQTLSRLNGRSGSALGKQTLGNLKGASLTLLALLFVPVAVRAQPISHNTGSPFGRIGLADIDHLEASAQQAGVDLMGDMKRAYQCDEAALARVFAYSLKLTKQDRDAETYGQLIYSSYLNMGEQYGTKYYDESVARQPEAVRQRIRDFLYYVATLAPKARRQEAETSARESAPLLFPPDYVFGSGNPIFGGKPAPKTTSRAP